MVVFHVVLYCAVKEIGASVTTRLSSLSTTTECYFLDNNLRVNNMLSTIDKYMISPTLMAFVLSSEQYNLLDLRIVLPEYWCTCAPILSA